MKHLLIIIFSIGTLTQPVSNMLQYQPAFISTDDRRDDVNLIKVAVEGYYIKGLQTRNFSLIRTICIEETKLYGVRKDGSLNITTLDSWSINFDPENPPFESLDYQIKRIDVEGAAAQVKIRFVLNGEREIHDYLNMLKIKGKWRIVNIIDY